MAAQGIGEFDCSAEDWTAYCERFQQYFTARDIDNEAKKRAMLPSDCGALTYQVILNLVAPEKPADKPLQKSKNSSKTIIPLHRQ